MEKVPIHNQSPVKPLYLKFSDALVNLSMPPESPDTKLVIE